MTDTWSGTFSSEMYTSLLVRGEIMANLPSGLKDVKELSGKEYGFDIKYRGIFRNETLYKLVTKVVGNQFITQIGIGQIVTFTIEKFSSDRISGTYQSVSPNDLGSFEIKRVI